MKCVLYILIAAAVVFALASIFMKSGEDVIVTNFEECVAEGNPVMESYPRQCRQGEELFVEEIEEQVLLPNDDDSTGSVVDDEGPFYTNASEDDIVIESLSPGDTISSPLTVSGKARGYWFFEATFPIDVVDWDGKIITTVGATAEGEWMTEEFIPFTATIEFETPEPGGPEINRGALIFRRDNASGLPEHDAAVEVPIVFE